MRGRSPLRNPLAPSFCKQKMHILQTLIHTHTLTSESSPAFHNKLRRYTSETLCSVRVYCEKQETVENTTNLINMQTNWFHIGKPVRVQLHVRLYHIEWLCQECCKTARYDTAAEVHHWSWRFPAFTWFMKERKKMNIALSVCGHLDNAVFFNIVSSAGMLLQENKQHRTLLWYTGVKVVHAERDFVKSLNVSRKFMRWIFLTQHVNFYVTTRKTHRSMQFCSTFSLHPKSLSNCSTYLYSTLCPYQAQYKRLTTAFYVAQYSNWTYTVTLSSLTGTR